MARDKHPPKKIHKNRPRKEPMEPLSQLERSLKAQTEFEKAMIHLLEAERMAQWDGAPNACVHSAYYAMHHAAAAAILAAGGVGKRKDVPGSHEHIIEHYGKLVALKGEALSATGQHLNRARTDRMIADYDLVRGASIEDSKDAARHARSMIDLIMEEWDFYDKITTEQDY